MQGEVQYIIMQDLFNGRSQWLTFYGHYDKPHAFLLNLKTYIDPHASKYPQKNSTLRFHHLKWRISTVICFLDYRIPTTLKVKKGEGGRSNEIFTLRDVKHIFWIIFIFFNIFYHVIPGYILLYFVYVWLCLYIFAYFYMFFYVFYVCICLYILWYFMYFNIFSYVFHYFLWFFQNLQKYFEIF